MAGDWGEQRNDVDVYFIAPRNLHQSLRFMGKTGTKKAKRKNRSSSSGSSNPSPIEKKLKGFSFEDESHVEGTIATEMSATASNAVDDVGSKLSKILERLDKLDSIESNIKEVRDSVQKLESTVTKLKSDVAELDKSVKFIDADLEDFKAKTNEDIASLHKNLLYQEAYSRRENLKFLNIPEQTENSSESDHAVQENTKDVIYSFLEDKLQIPDARKIEFQRLHRNGKASGKKPRPILVRFLRFTDRERVLKHARNLKDTPYAIHEDLPYEIVECRRQQIKKLKRARENGQTAHFSRSEPDKLYINGQYVPM